MADNKESGRRLRATRIVPGRTEPFPGGGFLTYFEDQKYPVHGIPSDEGMWIAEVLKKYLVSWLVFFSKSPQRYLLILASPVLLLFFNKMARDWLDEFGRYVDGVANKLMKTQYLSPATRHLFDVLMELGGGDVTNGKVIWGLCIFFEQDKGYRWPWQDIMMCVRKDQLILHPGKEMVRLVDIYCQRDQRVHYRKLGWPIKFFLWTQPKICKAIGQFAERADFTKFYFDNYDLWGATQSQVIDGYNYAYGGWTKEEMEINFAKM